MRDRSQRGEDMPGPLVDLAFRRLQIALQRRGVDFEGTTLHAAVVAAAQIVEHGAEPLDFLPDCETRDREHWWTEWRSNPMNALREDRFCFDCGMCESQELRGGETHA